MTFTVHVDLLLRNSQKTSVETGNKLSYRECTVDKAKIDNIQVVSINCEQSSEPDHLRFLPPHVYITEWLVTVLDTFQLSFPWGKHHVIFKK